MQAARHHLRVVSLVLFAGLVSILLGALASGTAYAAPLRVASFFGKTGSGNGEFSNTTGVGGLAVNRTGTGGVEPGSVYAVDRGGNRVERFAPNPLTGAYEYKSQFGVTGTEGGKFTTPQSVAIDPSDGSIYVLDGGNERLQKFSAIGTFQWAVGQNVLTGSPTTGMSVCTVAANCKAGTVGTQGGTFAAFPTTGVASGGGVAVEPGTGNVYVTDPGNSRVQEFASSGSFLRAFGWNVASFGPGNAGTAEVQSVKVPSDGGTFTLTFNSQTTGGSATGTLAATSKEVTALSSAAGFVVGEVLSGEGIPPGTTITAVGTNTLNISNAATLSKAGVSLSANLSATSSATQVEAALNALSSIGGGGAHGRVSVSGGPGDASGSHPYEIAFGGSLLGENVGQISAGSGGLSSPLGSELKCAGGPAAATLTYQWLHNGQVIAGANSSTYATSEANGDKEKAIQCRVLAQSAEGATAKASTGAPIVASPYPAIAPPTPGTPTVSGSAEAGKKLTCAPGTWTASPAFSFQWLRNGASLGSANGAQTNEYEIQSADLGSSIQCEVTGSNLAAGGGAAVADSTGTIPLAVSPANTGLPATAPVVADITQTATPPVAGDVLSCTSGTWTGATGFKYQWLSGGAAATGSGAQTASYTVAAADAGKAIQCLVTAENAQGKASAVSANLVAQTPPSPLPPVRPTTAISVTGTRTVGQTLTCAHGTWTNATGIEYTYTWLRGGQAIAGSTTGQTTANGTYKLVTEDADTQVQCQITATTTTSGSSVALSPSAASISPSISAASATLSGAPAITTATTTEGAPAFEICTLAEGCQKGATATAAKPELGEFAASQPTRIAVDASGDVYTVESKALFRVQRFAPSLASLAPEVFDPTDLTGTTETGNNANTPLAVAVEPVSDNVEVAKAFPKGATPICPTGLESVAAESRMLTLSPSGSLLEVGLGCNWTALGAVNGITAVNGLAAGSGGTSFISSTAPEQRVYVLNSTGASPPPAATIEAASGVGTHGATLNADVTALCPSPLVTGYHFEYRREEAGAPWVNLPASDASLATTGQVSQTIASGLLANQPYGFRVALNCQYGSASLTSGEKSFTTNTLPIEEAATLEPWPIGDTFATLRGELNPNNTAAQWRFQYVDDATFQADQPNGFEHAKESAVETATGGVAKEVSLEVGELEPSTTYHYRLVAENGLGPKALAPERTFITYRPSAAGLGAPRAYELVSSADKGGGDAMVSPLVTYHSNFLLASPVVASQGGAIAWSDYGATPNPSPTGGIANWYRSVRNPEKGWEVQPLVQPESEDPATDFETLLKAASADLSTVLLGGTTANLATGEKATAENFLLEAGASALTVPGKGPDINHISTYQLSPDGSHAFFDTQAPLLPEDTTNPSAEAHQLYEWTKEGGLHLAGVDSAGNLTSPCGALLAGMGGSAAGISTQDVSDDGSRVAFYSPDPSASNLQVAECQFGSSSASPPVRAYVSDVYLRAGASTTTDISKPPVGVPDFGASFIGMTPSGSTAFLASESKLTSDDPAQGSGNADLYRYDSTRKANEVQKATVKGSTGTFTVSMPSATGFGKTANSSPTVTEVEAASGEFRPGDAISGGGIQPGTMIASVDAATHELTLSANAGSGNGASRVLSASETTGALAFDVPASGGSGATASLENALDELPVVKAGGGSVSVTSTGGSTEPAGATYAITFDGGPLADAAQPLLGATGSGGAAATVEPSIVGGPLTRLSVAQPGGEANAAVSPAPAGQGLARSAIASEDGTHVYFLACGQLIPGKGKTFTENGECKTSSTTRNLYLWAQGGGLTYIANVKGAAGISDGPGPERTRAQLSPLRPSTAAVTPDGSDLVFSSTSELSGYDSRETSVLYRYDAPSGQIACISCSPVGISIQGEVTKTGKAGRSPALHTNYIDGAESTLGAPFASQLGGLSRDGSTVFFASTDQLLPQATNVEGVQEEPNFNAIYDIYVWYDGRLSLVSTGKSASSDFLLGASSSGREVYFLTASQLVPKDHDHAYDIYSYTTEGGFREEAAPPSCEPLADSSCQGPLALAPAPAGTASASFSGPTSPEPLRKAKKKKKKSQRHRSKEKHHRKTKRHGRHPRRAHTNRRAAR